MAISVSRADASDFRVEHCTPTASETTLRGVGHGLG